MKKFLALLAMLLSVVPSPDGQIKEETAVEEPAVINYMTVGLLDSPAASYDNEFKIICEGKVPDNILRTVEEYTSLIPEVILENTADNGFVYIIDPSGENTEDHAGMATFPDCIVNGEKLHLKDNTTPPGGKIAVMGDTLSRTKMAAIHEVGHAVDFIIAESYGYSTVFEDEVYMSMEGDPEWQRIFEEENELSGFPDYNRKCALEYFAEVFRYVFEDPTMLDNVPQSKQYMIDLLESFYQIDLE